ATTASARRHCPLTARRTAARPTPAPAACPPAAACTASTRRRPRLTPAASPGAAASWFRNDDRPINPRSQKGSSQNEIDLLGSHARRRDAGCGGVWQFLGRGGAGGGPAVV